MATTSLFRSRPVPAGATGLAVDLTPNKIGWQLIHFSVRHLAAGAVWDVETREEEVCLILLRGACRTYADSHQWDLGPRQDVFAGYPHAVYFPAETRFRFVADTTCEIADGRAPARKRLEPRLIRPEDCGYEIRGGGNATRQIVDIMPPDFPADRLLVCEVFTPSGNWSSYPPHKHDTDNPPVEVDLEEIYYYRFQDSGAYGFQRLYNGPRDESLVVRNGDVVPVRDGYHPFVTAYGYDAYYLNVLAGERRSMAASDDPRYAQFRQSWPAPDPRLPLVPPPPALRGVGRVPAAQS